MGKEIDYWFNKDGQIVRIENKLSTPLSKELPEEPTEEIHSFKSSKYFLAIFEVICIICCFAMYIQMIVIGIKLAFLTTQHYFTLFLSHLPGIALPQKEIFEVILESGTVPYIIVFLYSWSAKDLLKKAKFTTFDEIVIDCQGIIFWLSFFALSGIIK